MEKGSARVTNSMCSSRASLLPPKIPIPATCQSYTEYVGHESNPHHRRTSSESLLIEKPSWFDELLDEPETPFRKGAHRRSSSDSFAYTDVGNVVSNIVESSGSAQSLQKEDGIPSLASVGKEATEPAIHDSKGSSVKNDSSHGKPSPSEAVLGLLCSLRIFQFLLLASHMRSMFPLLVMDPELMKGCVWNPHHRRTSSESLLVVEKPSLVG